MNKHITENISFEQALQLTEDFLVSIEKNELKEEEIQETITNLVSSENGARGFFVTYLTTDKSLADTPTKAVIKALKSSPEIVSELLVKNLAMSSAMVITHQRNNDQEAAKGSGIVTQRTTNLIKQVNLDLVLEKLQKLQATIIEGAGNYSSFLERWGYDKEQKTVIQDKVKDLIV
ncbi:MAG: hypothetical protein AAGF26_01005 [Cyanobacteria bacterium P01_G01_bin.49]